MTAGSASARVVQSFGNTGADRLRFPGPMAFGPDGLLHVVDRGDAARDPVFVRVYTPAGVRAGGFRVAAGRAGDSAPVAADAAGNTYVGIPGAVLKYSLAGALLARLPVPPVPGAPPGPPVGVGVDAAGRVVTFDAQDSRFDTFDPAGGLVARFRHPPPGNGFDRRVGIWMTSAGTIYAYDRNGISVLDSSGAVARRLARPPILGIFGTLVDGPGGTVYVVAGGRVHKLGPGGEYLGAVSIDATGGEPMTAVGPDGSIYITAVDALRRGPNGAVLKLAPITTVDVTAPSIRVRLLANVSLRAPARLSYTLSEDAELRVSIKRRATATLRRDLSSNTVRAAATAGSHRFVLDWRALGYKRGPRLGEYELTFVARDESGNESRPARVTFTVRPGS